MAVDKNTHSTAGGQGFVSGFNGWVNSGFDGSSWLSPEILSHRRHTLELSEQMFLERYLTEERRVT